jgi:hypothetical protein
MATRAQDYRTVRDFLRERYKGVIPVTPAMVNAVLDGIAEDPELGRLAGLPGRPPWPRISPSPVPQPR